MTKDKNKEINNDRLKEEELNKVAGGMEPAYSLTRDCPGSLANSGTMGIAQRPGGRK